MIMLYRLLQQMYFSMHNRSSTLYQRPGMKWKVSGYEVVSLILNIFFFRKKAVQVSDGAFVESIRILWNAIILDAQKMLFMVHDFPVCLIYLLQFWIYMEKAKVHVKHFPVSSLIIL